MTQDQASSLTKQIVVFKLYEEEFGFDIAQVKEIILPSQITPIPNAPDYIKGVLNLRGKIIIVIDLAKRLGFPPLNFDDDIRIIVVEMHGNMVGMAVGLAKEVLTISESSLQPAPSIISEKISSDYIERVAVLDKRIILLLNIREIFDSDVFNFVKDRPEAQQQPDAKNPAKEQEGRIKK